ncbi:carbohydrate-binding family 9-like protein [Paenibacillus sp. strain BS8-2]
MLLDQVVKRYSCKPAAWRSGNACQEPVDWSMLDWSNCEWAALSETVSGEAVKEPTSFRACWSEEYVYMEFSCVDHYAVSQYTEHDDPLYEQDVVEVFIEFGAEDGGPYVELEVSPNNVVFDAKVWNNGNGGIHTIDLEWNMEGLVTEVEAQDDHRYYRLAIPTRHFAKQPEPGISWRMNAYRIDEDEAGNREYQAWSPTGAINYHVQSRFGELLFL